MTEYNSFNVIRVPTHDRMDRIINTDGRFFYIARFMDHSKFMMRFSDHAN